MIAIKENAPRYDRPPARQNARRIPVNESSFSVINVEQGVRQRISEKTAFEYDKLICSGIERTALTVGNGKGAAGARKKEWHWPRAVL
jgi:hypothetical protein